MYVDLYYAGDASTPSIFGGAASFTEPVQPERPSSLRRELQTPTLGQFNSSSSVAYSETNVSDSEDDAHSHTPSSRQETAQMESLFQRAFAGSEDEVEDGDSEDDTVGHGDAVGSLFTGSQIDALNPMRFGGVFGNGALDSANPVGLPRDHLSPGNPPMFGLAPRPGFRVQAWTAPGTDAFEHPREQTEE